MAQKCLMKNFWPKTFSSFNKCIDDGTIDALIANTSSDAFLLGVFVADMTIFYRFYKEDSDTSPDDDRTKRVKSSIVRISKSIRISLSSYCVAIDYPKCDIPVVFGWPLR